MTDPRPPAAPVAPPDSAPVRSAPADADGLAPTPEFAAVPPVRSRGPLTARNYLWIVAAALVVVLALHFLGPVLTPFLIGAILAYLGTPLVEWASGRGVPRAVSTVVVILLFGLALCALFLVLVPLIQAEVALAYRLLPDLVGQATARVSPWLQEHFGIAPAFNFEALKTFVSENMESARDLSLSLLSGVRTGGRIVVSVLLNLALIPVVMFYVLRDWHMIGERVSSLVPRAWAGKTHSILTDIDRVLAEFLRGQLLVMLVLAVYYAIGLSIVGLDRAIAIGILTGLLVFIPYVGFGLGLILGLVAALLQWTGWPAFLAVLAVYMIGQLLEGYVLVPWLVGDRIGLHPLAVIFALLAFGQLFGFAGVLLALPASAALLVGLRHLRAAYLASPVYRGTQ
jgi:predicted PurR-regulated permease PerM